MSDRSPDQFNEVAEVYDDLMSVVPYRWWVDYVERIWRSFGVRPRRVLDLACGTGNVLAELLRRGYEAEGSDASAAMLGVARRKLSEDVSLWCQDFRSLAIPGAPFDACVCLFDSLNYLLKVEELYRAFRRVWVHLRPGGFFIFDMNAIRALETGMFNQSGTGSDPGLRFVWKSAWEPATRLCTIHMEFQEHREEGTRTFYETHVQRGYTLEEIRAGLHGAGFRVHAIYDAFTMSPPRAKTDRIYIVAEALPASAAP
jgi:ubiquinone/menaquinone biosynthesis C-methylase UbiE